MQGWQCHLLLRGKNYSSFLLSKRYRHSLKLGCLSYVLIIWSECEWHLGEGANFNSKLRGVLTFLGRRSSLVKIFQSCVHFDFDRLFTHLISCPKFVQPNRTIVRN